MSNIYANCRVIILMHWFFCSCYRLGFEGSVTKFKLFFSSPCRVVLEVFSKLTAGPGRTVVCESNKHRLGIPLAEY